MVSQSNILALTLVSVFFIFHKALLNHIHTNRQKHTNTHIVMKCYFVGKYDFFVIYKKMFIILSSYEYQRKLPICIKTTITKKGLCC